ncbi:class I SAM-dependent methyltransferase [Acidihalobacter prosperus]|uniref:class I SAM-dependent methyltransferase n=1 Tax=Acidihalobacter prosperus TaxID=160660 RepID=UPI0011AB5327|nr:class I SAM-dependent methyltransferase [Acidihalobacter prosperus]
MSNVDLRDADIKADEFMSAISRYMRPFLGTHIYEAKMKDYSEKTNPVGSGYASWLESLMTEIRCKYALGKDLKILDFGCGTGELTVILNLLGYDAYGVDLHREHLGFARILARENNVDEIKFIEGDGDGLPFEDKSFDVVTMFVVLEHLSDRVLGVLMPELKRVCRHVLFVLVPNKIQLRDDHTGLAFLPWMPRWLALGYLKLRGKRHQYLISDNGSWDVYYRSLSNIERHFDAGGFEISFISDENVFPSLSLVPPINGVFKNFHVRGKSIRVGVPIPRDWLINKGVKKQYFYPYLNLLFEPKGEG